MVLCSEREGGKESDYSVILVFFRGTLVLSSSD